MLTPTPTELFDAARGVEKLGQKLNATLSRTSVEELVEFGHKLWLLARRATAALEGVKEALRNEGVARGGGVPGSVSIDASDGSRCRVVVPKSGLVLKKGADIEGLKSALGDDFDAYFETVVTYKPRAGLRAKVASKGPTLQAQAILDAVSVVEGTPKIYFEG